MMSVVGVDAWDGEIEEAEMVFEGLGYWSLHGENR